MKAIIRNKKNKILKTIDDNNLGSLVRIFLSSIFIIFVFYSLPLVLNFTNDNNCSEIFNLGSGAPCSNKDLLDAVQRHTGKMDIKFEPNRAGDPAYLVADINKVKQILDWEPTQSSIDNVVATALKWYNKVHKKEIQ